MTGWRVGVLGGRRLGVSPRAVAAGVAFTLLAVGYAVWALAADGSAGGGGAGPTHFPLRVDRLVVSVPTEMPAGPAPPGELDAVIAGFDGRPGGKTLDPAGLTVEEAGAVAAALDGLFGTPIEPRMSPGGSGESAELARGVRLYAEQCRHCHGLTGDGRGLGAAYLYPHPRDYRAGLFKSADGGGKPTRERLKRVLREGVPGTPMPMFDLIPEADVDALVAAVVHLSTRGEVEAGILRGLLGEDGTLSAADIDGEAKTLAGRVAGGWESAKAVAAGGGDEGRPDGDSVRRGHRVFTGVGACVQCHGADGKGAAYKFDVWGGVVRPADLTQPPGDFKWGRHPGDWAGHVRGGILPVGMPASPGLSDREVADVVQFVRGLSLGALPADVRERLKGAK